MFSSKVFFFFLWLEIQPDKIKWWSECKRLGQGKKVGCVCVCVWERGGVGDIRCYLLVSEACLSCQSCSFTAVLFPPPLPLVLWWHNSLVLPCGKHCCGWGCVCVRARGCACVCSVTHCHIFLSSAFKLCQRLDKKYSVELLQARWAEQNSFRILALDPHLTLQLNITVLFFRE